MKNKNKNEEYLKVLLIKIESFIRRLIDFDKIKIMDKLEIKQTTTVKFLKENVEKYKMIKNSKNRFN